MLRTNLSTRPFYHERAVHAVILLAAVVVMVLTAATVTRVIQLSRQNTGLEARVSRDEAEADRLTREAAAVRRGLDREELQVIAAAAREANALIDQRTFSWTEFFNYIESTLPPDVMLTDVRPSVRDGVTRVSMTVLARRTEDVDEFVEKLEATGAFENVLPAQEDRTQQGLERAVLQTVYTGGADDSDGVVSQPAASAPQPSGPAAAPPAPAPAQPSAGEVKG